MNGAEISNTTLRVSKKMIFEINNEASVTCLESEPRFTSSAIPNAGGVGTPVCGRIM
jgi:hypothetical protein